MSYSCLKGFKWWIVDSRGRVRLGLRKCLRHEALECAVAMLQEDDLSVVVYPKLNESQRRQAEKVQVLSWVKCVETFNLGLTPDVLGRTAAIELARNSPPTIGPLAPLPGEIIAKAGGAA